MSHAEDLVQRFSVRWGQYPSDSVGPRLASCLRNAMLVDLHEILAAARDEEAELAREREPDDPLIDLQEDARDEG